MIRSVRFRAFKAFSDVSISLGRLNLIVGPNASGKTSILEGLHYLTQCGAKPPQRVLTGPRDPRLLRTRGSDNPIKLAATVQVEGRPSYLTVEETSIEKSGFEREWYRVTISDGEEQTDVPIAQRPEGFEYESYGRYPTLKAIKSAVLLHLDPRRLAEPSWTEEVVPRVEFDGYGLPSVLADLAASDPDTFHQMQDAFCTIVPSARKVRATRMQVNYDDLEEVDTSPEKLYRWIHRKLAGHEMRFDFVGAQDLPASAVSEGSLLTVGLLAIAMGPARPRLILLDEIERGLHPKALGSLVDRLRQLLAAYPDLQIVATTHSPYLVDSFDAKEILLTDIRPDGTTRVGRLDEHPDFDRWKDEMRPGEFWSSVGEQWLGGDNVEPTD